MQVAMLGPLEVRADSGEVLDVGGARLRTLLIMLALRPGRLPAHARPARHRHRAVRGAGRRAPFGLPAEEQADALGRLLTALAGQQTLLVIDNCEHLVAAAAALADRILAACPRVRILATSREPLNITGEALWTVGPLTLAPDPAATSDQAERSGLAALALEDYASVRLFTQRARAVCPGLEVTLANAPAVASICRASADAPVIAEALAGLADLALREGTPERAAELLGASVAVRGAEDRSVQDEERVADEARSVLGPARYGEFYHRRQRVTLGTLAAFLTPGA